MTPFLEAQVIQIPTKSFEPQISRQTLRGRRMFSEQHNGAHGRSVAVFSKKASTGHPDWRVVFLEDGMRIECVVGRTKGGGEWWFYTPHLPKSSASRFTPSMCFSY